MTFLHKLSRRLARLKSRPLCAVAAVSAAAAIMGCELPNATSEPITPAVSQVVVLPQAVTVQQGQLQDFMAVGYTSTGDTAQVDVTWSTTSGSLATRGTNGGRHYGQYKNAQCGSFTVTATAQPSNVSGRASVTVTCPVPVGSVVVTPNTATVPAGLKTPLTATPMDTAGNPLVGWTGTVTWSSSNTAFATVDGSGLVSGIAPGSVTITATGGGQSGTSAVTVTSNPVVSVSVSPASASVSVGQTAQLTASPLDANGDTLTGRAVTWASSNTSVASVSSSGLVTGTGAGSATITATSENVKGTSAITVTTVAVASVSVLPTSATLQVSQTVQLAATPKDAGGNPLTGQAISWSTSKSSVASVSSSGLVTALGAGSATITATSGGKSGTSAITVTLPSPTGGGSGCGATGSGACYYVDASSGSDANPGTSALPFRTLQQAANVVKAGDGVLVNDGVYTGGSTVLIISTSGTAANWIVFRAAHRWGAVVDGQNNSSTAGIAVRSNYVRVEGFEVRGTDRSGIEAYAGSSSNAVTHDVTIAQNLIHDIGRRCTDDTGGRVGVNAYATNMIIEQNVIHDIGRLSPGEQGCSPSSTNWQNHDHGIYHEVGDNLIVRNNIFYSNTHGWSYHRYSGGGSSAQGVYILNNTFAFPNPNRPGQIVIAARTDGLVIANNVFYQPNTAGIWFDASDGGSWSGVVVENNLSTTAIQTGASVTLTASVQSTDPKFVSTSQLNFHLQTGSPAINVGATLGQVTNDFDGVARPQGGGYDIGAYEFH